MAKTHSSEVDRYLLYWISAGSEGKRIFLIKNLIILIKTFVMNFFCNIKELFPVKPQVNRNSLMMIPKILFSAF